MPSNVASLGLVPTLARSVPARTRGRLADSTALAGRAAPRRRREERQVRDVHRRERELAHRCAELERLRDEFVAAAHHELRTPLTSVVGYTELLLDGAAGPLTGEQEQMLARVESNGSTLLRLLERLLRDAAHLMAVECDALGTVQAGLE